MIGREGAKSDGPRRVSELRRSREAAGDGGGDSEAVRGGRPGELGRAATAAAARLGTGVEAAAGDDEEEEGDVLAFRESVMALERGTLLLASAAAAERMRFFA